MTWQVRTAYSTDPNSREAGRECARAVIESTTGPVRGAVLYFSLLHDVEALVEAIRELLGPDVPLVGTSTQGIVGRGIYAEEGFFCGLMTWSGDVDVRAHVVRNIQVETFPKGEELGRMAAATGSAGHRLSVLLYDPLCGANARDLIRGFDEAAHGTPLIGGASGAPWGRIVETIQVYGGERLHASAVMLTISGPFSVLTAASTGTAAIGSPMRVTRADGNRLLELDGQPALEMWTAVTGLPAGFGVEEAAGWAIGVERGGPGSEHWTVLSALRCDHDTGAVVLQSDVPEGSRVMTHERSPEIIFERTREMAMSLARATEGRTIAAILTFECGARTGPFLGLEASKAENAIVEQTLARPETAWLGLLAWGEVAPTGRGHDFYNYTYPIAVLVT